MAHAARFVVSGHLSISYSKARYTVRRLVVFFGPARLVEALLTARSVVFFDVLRLVCFGISISYSRSSN